MMTRRDVIAMAAAGAAPSGPLAGCQTNAWKIGGYDELLPVLAEIRSLDYHGFETSFRNVPSQFANAAAARKQITATGLRFLGVHIFLPGYDPETSLAPWDLLTAVADGAAGLGAERVILSGSPAAGAGRKRKIDGLNRAGDYCRKRDLTVAYHNHDAEFTSGEIDSLISGTDPSRVWFLVDAGHAIRANADLVGLFKNHAGRICGFHLRDALRGNEVALGTGENDYAPLAAAAKAGKFSGWLIAEEERRSGEKPGTIAARTARQHIRKLFGV